MIKIFKINNNIIKNLGFVFTQNFISYVIPFLTFPYLVIVLGVKGFGLYNFSSSFTNYFLIICEYSFNITATRDVSINRHDEKKINEIVSSVYVIKMFFLIVTFLFVLLLFWFIPKFKENFIFHLFVFLSIFGQVLIPNWFFQGCEKLKSITLIIIISKIINTILIFLLVKNASNLLMIPIINLIIQFLVGLICLQILIKRFNVKFFIPKKDILKEYFRNGWHIFISNISVSLYTSTMTVLLGFFYNNTIVGFYSIADKIISALKTLISPLSQVLYPYLNKVYVKCPKDVLKINKKIFIYLMPMFFMISILVFIFSPEILQILFHEKNENIIVILRILSIIPSVIFLHTLFALFTLLIFGKNKEYSRIIVSAGILNLILGSMFIYFFKHIGAAISVVFVEFYILIRYFIYSYKNNINFMYYDKYKE